MTLHADRRDELSDIQKELNQVSEKVDPGHTFCISLKRFAAAAALLTAALPVLSQETPEFTAPVTVIDNPFATPIRREEPAEIQAPSSDQSSAPQTSTGGGTMPATDGADNTAVHTQFGLTKEEIAAREARERREKARQERLKNRHAVTFEGKNDAKSKEPRKAVSDEKAKELTEARKKHLRRKFPVTEHVYQDPSPAFLKFFNPWSLKVGPVTFLETNVRQLIARYPDCRVVAADSNNVTDIVACPDPAPFAAEGDEVIFEYLHSNDVLVAAEYFFADLGRARHFARLIVREVETRNETFTAATGEAVDSPLFKVSVQEAQGGFMVKVAPHLKQSVDAYETYGRENIRSISFGSLEIGRTKAEALRSDEGSCRRTNPENSLVAEFYGKCFNFPYEAHYQVDLSPDTGVVQLVAMTPVEVLTSGLVETALEERYGRPKFCERIESDVELVKSNRNAKFHRTTRTDRVKKRNVTVYAGHCEDPIVFTSDERYVFVNSILTAQRISQDYTKRRAENRLMRDTKREIDRRQGRLEGFF